MLRKVRVFQEEHNHMQSTPMNRIDHWTMQYETIGQFRSHSMLWSRCTDDPYHRWGDKGEIYGHNANEVVELAKASGKLLLYNYVYMI